MSGELCSDLQKAADSLRHSYSHGIALTLDKAAARVTELEAHLAELEERLRATYPVNETERTVRAAARRATLEWNTTLLRESWMQLFIRELQALEAAALIQPPKEAP